MELEQTSLASAFLETLLRPLHPLCPLLDVPPPLWRELDLWGEKVGFLGVLPLLEGRR